jgi:hypothetical protein
MSVLNLINGARVTFMLKIQEGNKLLPSMTIFVVVVVLLILV